MSSSLFLIRQLPIISARIGARFGVGPLAVLLLCLTTLPVYGQTAPAPNNTTTSNPANEPTPATGDTGGTASAQEQPDAGTPETVTEEEPAVPRSERDKQLFAAAAPEEIRWLETPRGKILALFRPSENRMTHGVLLILHSAELPATLPAGLENLRRNLPQHGWITLALNLPNVAATEAPTRAPILEQTKEANPAAPTEEATTQTNTEAAQAKEVAEEVTPDTPPSTPAIEAVPEISRVETIAQNLDAAITFLSANGQKEVVLLVDNASAYDSLQHLSALNATGGEGLSIKALVMVNLQPQDLLSKDQLTAIFSPPTRPIMDVFPGPDNNPQVAVRKRHRAQALSNKVDIYHQMILPPLPSTEVDNARSFWLERIRGFMKQTQGDTGDVRAKKDN